MLMCSNCSTPATCGQKFCAECGATLGSRPTAAAVNDAPNDSVRTPVAERRLCSSILFCDLVGFTPLAEERDAEDVRELLSSYFDLARTVVTRYGGAVEKFIGDAVMAVWGAPRALEGDTERAVRAALDMIDAVAAFGPTTGVPGLAARVGVVTGEVAVTIGARGQGMVAGDAVNTAARIQAAAGPNEVFVDDATRRIAQSAVKFEEAGTHQLKGKREPVQLSRAVRVLSGVGGTQRVDGLEGPLIGRDVEARLIKDLFHSCVERRTPRFVLVCRTIVLASPGWPGSSRSTPTGFLPRCGGTGAVVRRTQTAWPSGRWPR